MAGKSTTPGANIYNFDSATGNMRSRSEEDKRYHENQEKQIARAADKLLTTLAKRDPARLKSRMGARHRDVNYYAGRGLCVLPVPHYYYQNGRVYIGFSVR